MQQFRAQQAITWCRLSGDKDLFSDMTPHPEPCGEVGVVIGGGPTVTRRAETRGNTTERRQQSLRRIDSAEPFHGAFAAPGRLV